MGGAVTVIEAVALTVLLAAEVAVRVTVGAVGPMAGEV